MNIEGRIELRGRAAQELGFSIERELEESDLVVRASSSVGSVSPGIKSLRATHHKLAQVLSSGFSDTEASLSTGYSPSRISILKNDPAFQELLAHYSDKREEVFVDVQSRMAGFATSAVEVLQERIEDKPENFTNRDLNDLIKTTADRGGHSPVARSETRNINLTGAELLALKQEVLDKQNGQIRTINQGEESARVKAELERRSKSQEDSGSPISSNDNGAPGEIRQEATLAREPGEGDNI